MNKEFAYKELEEASAELLAETIRVSMNAPGEVPRPLKTALARVMFLMRQLGMTPEEMAGMAAKAGMDYRKKETNEALERIVANQSPARPEEPKEDLPPSKRTTACGMTPNMPDDAPVPRAEKLADGQHTDHWVLSAEERAKGFIRPVRTAYKHVGIAGPTFPLSDLSPEQKEIYGGHGYVKYEEYPKGYKGSALGRFWTQAQLDKVGKGCGTVTTMGLSIAETYARQPGYYGRTFCCGCHDYLPVGADGEFVWTDEKQERVGT